MSQHELHQGVGPIGPMVCLLDLSNGWEDLDGDPDASTGLFGLAGPWVVQMATYEAVGGPIMATCWGSPEQAREHFDDLSRSYWDERVGDVETVGDPVDIAQAAADFLATMRDALDARDDDRGPSY